MNNLVSLNNNIFHHIVKTILHVRYNKVLIVSIGHASRTRYNKRVGLVVDEKTHCFQSYNQGYRKTSNN